MSVVVDAKVKNQSDAINDSSPQLQSIKHLVTQAIEQGATDIHIEPRVGFVSVRYRIGNELRLGTKFPLPTLEKLIAACKELADLNPQDTARPQEGHFSLSVNGEAESIRVATLPILGGEKIVLHLHSNSVPVSSLEALGYWGENLHLLKRSFARLRGLVVIASSGRNTNALTLHSIANFLNHPPLKLGTLEDPITYKISRAIQVEAPSTSAAYLTQLLMLEHQGVNVFLLTGVPDSQALKGVLQLAKNHLVCLSVSAVDSVSALQHLMRLRDKLEHDSLNIQLIVGQTNLRQLCTYCKVNFVPSAITKQQLTGYISPFSIDQIHELEREAQKHGVGKDVPGLSSTNEKILHLWQPKHGGCEHCNFSGYSQSHVVINEALDSSKPRIQHCLNHTVRRTTLVDAALDIGMIPRHIDGLIKSLRGVISFYDLIEVIGREPLQ